MNGTAEQAGGAEMTRFRGPVLAVSHVTKSFGAVTAIGDGSIELYPGEAHALSARTARASRRSSRSSPASPARQRRAASTGAGRLRGPAAARAAGVAMIYQEPTLFPDLTVAENIFMGRQPLGRRPASTARAMRAHAPSVFARLGVELDPGAPARGLSVADQQIVEIAKALSLDARVLVMDEPTAALTAVEVERLFARRARRCATQGAAVHVHLAPARRGLRASASASRSCATAGSVHRAGAAEADHRRPRARDGRPRPRRRCSRSRQPRSATSCSRSSGLTREGVFHDIRFERRGAARSSALAGLVGAGRTRGRARDLRHRPLRRRHGRRSTGSALPERDRRRPRWRPGIALVPEDRRQQGLVMDLAIDRNVALASLAAARAVRAHPPRRASATLGADWASGCSSSTAGSRTASRRSPAATSRRSCSPSGWRREPTRADRRRADARHRRRHQGRGAPAARRARRPRAWPS